MGYWEVIAYIVGFCLGLRMITDEGKILFPVRNFFLVRYGSNPIFDFFASPFILCCACSASFWGSLIFWGIVWYGEISISEIIFYKWILTIITASFINGFFWSLYELVKKY